MKKILFTLFAFALVIVACEKDMDENYDVSNINPIEASIDYDYLGFLDGLAEDSPAVKDVKSGPSTARTGAAGTQWLHAIFFTLGTNELVYLSADTDPESCIPAGGVHASASNAVSVLYTFREINGNGLLQVQVGQGAVQNRGIPAASLQGYRNLFNTASLNYVRVANAQRSGTVAGAAPPASAFDFSCAPTVAAPGRISVVGGINDFTLAHDYPAFDVTFTTSGGAADEYFIVANGTDLTGTVSGSVLSIPAGQSSGRIRVRARNSAGETSNIITVVLTVAAANTVTASDYYTITDAPFPLTGKLATMNSGYASAAGWPGGVSLNYAGTTEAAVVSAIEADIMNAN